MIAPARRAATDVSVLVDSGRQDLATALADAHGGLSDGRDRALLTELATGVQRWLLALDFAIHALTGRQVADLDPEVRATLRLGLYQLQHASRTPPSAVVNDAVEIVKRGPTRSASGLVNAVLRRVLRDGPPRLPEAPRVAVDDPAWRPQALAYLAITHSHPVWLVERWLDRVGFEQTEAWVHYDNTPADVTIWPLTRDEAAPLVPLDVAGTPTRYVPGGVVLTRGSDAMPLLREARAYAQDEASAAVAVVAGVVGTGRVLDACASPGGKTIAMRRWLPDVARPIAADLRARRVALLAATLRRAGSAVPIVRSDARQLPFAGTIDTLLIDAPCSGLGTLRREPDLRWRRTASDQASQVTLQRSLVEEGLRVLAPGGRLIYATCSSEPEENEDLVAAVLAAHPDWQLLDLRTVALPASMAPLVSEHGWLRTWPYLHGLDAFFAAVLQRRP